MVSLLLNAGAHRARAQALVPRGAGSSSRAIGRTHGVGRCVVSRVPTARSRSLRAIQ